MYKLNSNIHFDESNFQTITEIPVGNWLVMYNDMKDEYFLKEQLPFSLPNKLYGNCKELTSKFLYTFNNRSKNLGILLSGLKGTGKSLLSRNICVESGLPVIILTEPYQGTTFLNFLNKINQECVIFLDEFEKVYKNNENKSGQNSLLSILDGVFTNKFLFLLTINETNRLSEYLINRPGRIHYHIKYEGLDNSIITDVVEDKLINKANKDKIIHLCNYLGDISMDILTSIIEECNLYSDQEPKELIKDMNLECSNTFYNYKVWKNGVLVEESSTDSNPLNNNYYLIEYYYTPNKTVKKTSTHNDEEEYGYATEEAIETCDSECDTDCNESIDTNEAVDDTPMKSKDDVNVKPHWVREYMYFDSEEDPTEVIIETDAIKIKNSTYTVEFKKSKRYSFRY